MSGQTLVLDEQPFRPTQPAPHRCHQSGVHHQIHGDHRRRHRRSGWIAVCHEPLMELLPARHRGLEVTVSVVSACPQFERRRALGFDSGIVEQVEGDLPFPPVNRLLYRRNRAHCRIVTPIVTPSW